MSLDPQPIDELRWAIERVCETVLDAIDNGQPIDLDQLVEDVDTLRSEAAQLITATTALVDLAPEATNG